MKPFRFRLGRLARVRVIQEEVARAAWLVAERDARAAEDAVVREQAALGRATDELRRAQADPELSPADVLAGQRSLERLARHLRATRGRAERLRRDAERAREPWRAVAREVEGLQRLEERARDAHREESEREQNAWMDEVASTRAARAIDHEGGADRGARDSHHRSKS